MEGRIVRLNHNGLFGFIKAQGEREDRFFHKSDLQNRTFADLQEGQLVTFEPEKGAKGPRARTVQVLD